MFGHLILGFLRDGTPRYGYDIVIEYSRRCVRQANPGNFYRELGKLLGKRWIEEHENPPTADPRRRVYCITQQGARRFDTWLESSTTLGREMPSWLLFRRWLPRETATRLLEDRLDELWAQVKDETRLRDDALRRNGNHRKRPETEGPRADDGAGFGGRFDGIEPDPFVLLQQIKHLTAEVDLIRELLTELHGDEKEARNGRHRNE